MEILNGLLGDLGGDVEGLGGTVMPILAMQAGAGQWTGFSCDDFDFGDFPLGRIALPGGGAILTPNLGDPRIAAAGKMKVADLIQSAIRMASAQDGPTCGYNESTDRWEVVVDETIRENLEGIPFSLDIAMTVYVQYTGPGGYTDVPDETTTGMSQQFDIDLHLEVAMEEEGMDMSLILDLDLASQMSLTGLNTGIATMNGNSDIATDIDLQMEGELDPESTGLETIAVDGGFDLGVTSTNVRFAIDTESEEVCPTSGRVDGDLSIDIAMAADGDEETMIDDWTMSVVFNSNGTATMRLESVRDPSVNDQTTVAVCGSTLP